MLPLSSKPPPSRRANLLPVPRLDLDQAHAVLDAMAAIAFVVDARGVIRWVNGAYLGLTGFALDDVIGRPLWRVHYPPENAEQAERTFAEHGRQTLLEVPSVLESHLVTRTGKRRSIDWACRVHQDAQGESYAVVTGIDVTEWRSSELRVLVADRMASIGTLAAGVAHEINNPLAYISTNLSLLEEGFVALERDGYTPRAAVELMELVAEALDGAGRVRRIVGDLKTFSRVEDRQEAQSSNLLRTLDSAVNMASNEIRHRARLVKDYGPPMRVKGSEARLGQVFLNLLINAAQAIREGAAERNVIRISTGRVEDDAYIEVHDTGTGMSEDTLAQVFDPFFTTKAVGEGTGLGLSICHNVIVGLGGEITAESAPGRGSVFRVRLPLAEGLVNSRPAPKRVTAPPGARARVLVIDDDRLVASALRRVLRDHEVTLAVSGREGLAALEKRRDYDLVLCDVMMPDLTGMDVFDVIEEHYPELAARVVFITGGAFSVHAAEFLRAVSNRTLSKPFDPNEIRRLAREATQRSEPLRPQARAAP